MSDLMSLLRENPHDFDLFQAISILERSEPARAPVGTSLGVDEAVRLAAQVDLAFAPSDISSIADSDRPGPPLTLKSSAFSLAGAQGSLPMPFTEMLLERRRMRDHAGLDFLDIFNQRVLGLFYRSRRKHHLALAADDVADAPLVRSLDALSGLGRTEGARGPNGELAWLRHAGVQGAAPRSMASLLAVVRDRLGVHFSGRQFIGGWNALATQEQACLYDRKQAFGVQSRLGMGASLGARAWDQGAGMELSTLPLDAPLFSSLLPGGEACALLGWLVARHLQRDIQVSVRLDLKNQPSTRLGQSDPLAPRLGLSAWLCSPAGSKFQGTEGRAPVRYQEPCFMLQAATSPATAVPDRNQTSPERT
ncbi:type VI secretion system baseplate subunit TssG [Noviherbaspirillum sp. Root189]|uniref:type VI secretion system baseplate subunit TssG n=1 Tax=Noviherbaspirillum sp. Root189 TaxID=1736487 RepID=UPI000ABCBC4D|nr:type VI secretion system baseplate subunit TssG [Noviherbaspirillum sp. Root189]